MPISPQIQGIFDRIFGGTAPWMPGAQDPRVVGGRVPLPQYQPPAASSPAAAAFAPMLQGRPSPIATPPIPAEMPGEAMPFALGGPSPTAPMPPVGAGGDVQVPQGGGFPLPAQKPPRGAPRAPGNPLLGGPASMPSLSMMEGMPPTSPVDVTGGFKGSPEIGGARAVDPSLAGANGADAAKTDALTRMFGPDMGRNLMYFGAATMAAGAKPGATLGGSVGQGALTAMQASDLKRREDRADKKEDREALMAERKAGIEEKRADILDRYYKGVIDEKAATRELQDRLKTSEGEIKRMQAEGRISAETARLTIAQDRLAAQQSLNEMRDQVRKSETERKSNADQNKQTNDLRKDARDRARADATTVDPITGQKQYDSAKSAELYDRYLLENHEDAGIEAPETLRKRVEGRMGGEASLPTTKDGKPDPSKLVVGKTYPTARGPAKWNGTAFEPVKPGQ